MYYIGIDLGGTIIKIGLVAGGKVAMTRCLVANSDTGLADKLPAIKDSIDTLIYDYNVPTREFGGVTMAFPGIVDVGNARAAATNAKYNDAPEINMSLWVKVNWGVPFIMDNDARMATVGEWLNGAGRGTHNMVMMTIGTGIGTGVVIDDHLIYGRNSCAGSLGGHMIVDYRGRRCTCGNIGCIEAHASSYFLPEIINGSQVSERFKRDSVNYNFKVLFDKFRNGDEEAIEVVTSCMDVWSAGIVNYIHAYDPEVVVLGGGIMKSADVILPYVREKVNNLAWHPNGEIPVIASRLGDTAAILASEYYFK